MINKQIHNYKLTRQIGSGGMATVYEAVHIKLDTKVAIKVLDPVLAANESIRQRFMQEAKIMASLDHEGITRVIDFDESDNHLAIIMEYLDGQTMDEYVNQKGALNESQAKEIFIPILKAFEYAHKKGIVHRDVKPSNIFITKEGKVKIMDFGIAKLVEEGAKVLTQTGTQMGTPVYMSPEQVNDSKHIDHRTDIYSLGVTLWFMLTGQSPYNTDEHSSFQIFTKIVNNPLPELSSQYASLSVVISKATEKDLKKRLNSCKEFLKELITENIDVKKGQVEKQEESKSKDDFTLIEIETADDELWKKVKEKNTIDDYKIYLKKFPNGNYKEKAGKSIGTLILDSGEGKLLRKNLKKRTENSKDSSKTNDKGLSESSKSNYFSKISRKNIYVISLIAIIFISIIALFLLIGNNKTNSFSLVQDYFYKIEKKSSKKELKKIVYIPFWNDGNIITDINSLAGLNSEICDFLQGVSETTGNKAGKIFLNKTYPLLNSGFRNSDKEFLELMNENTSGNIENIEVVEIMFTKEFGPEEFNLLYVFVDINKFRILGIDDSGAEAKAEEKIIVAEEEDEEKTPLAKKEDEEERFVPHDDVEEEIPVPEEYHEESSQIFTVVEEMPSFPGGIAGLNKYLENNIKYPKMAKESGIQGRVFVTFVIEKDGSITDARILRGIGGGCDEESIRIVKSMPKWSPGKQRDKVVRTQYNLPIKFILN